MSKFEAPFSQLGDDAQAKLKEADQPEWMAPMLATLTDKRFSDPGWIYERKLDGQRCLAFVRDGDVRLMSRNKNKNNVQYPELVTALQGWEEKDFIVDGEIVAFEGDVTSFEKLQQRMNLGSAKEARESNVEVFFYLFDILYLRRYDTTQLAQRDRKSLLKRAFPFTDPIRFVPHRNTEGESFFDEACKKGWEGIIAKDADAPYVHTRSHNWLKFKCVNEQEFVVGGYTDPHGERIGFGALLLGYYEGDTLCYAGKVGTGFDDKTLRGLHKRLKKLERKTSPFAGQDMSDQGVHWVTPKLVAEIGFEEWTDAGRLRQPRYLGLRQDKPAEDVVKETPDG